MKRKNVDEGKFNRLLADNKKLREILWLRHGCTVLYGDDREMQCGHCVIDFKRDSPERIAKRFAAIGKRTLGQLKEKGFEI